VGGDLDNIVGGVGVRFLEVNDDDFVDALLVLDDAAIWLNQFCEDCAAGFKLMLQPNIGAAMARASGPASRTTPIPPRPGGVEMATMVSSRFIGSRQARRRSALSSSVLINNKQLNACLG